MKPVPAFPVIVVVGSSISDIGNRCGLPGDPDPLCFPVPPYAGTSTASNGPLYVELLAAHYGSALAPSSSGGFDYAYGGARTGGVPGDPVPHAVPDLRLQAAQFLARVAGRADPRFLYILDGAAFGNNARRVLELVSAQSELAATLPAQTATQAATDIRDIAQQFCAAGARRMLLINSPDLGTLPAIAAGGPVAVRLASAMSTGFNAALAAQVRPALRGAFPGLELHWLDLGALSARISSAPARHGFTNIRDACYPFFAARGAPVCSEPDAYAWWDELHPTAATHALIARRAVAAIGR
jgi:outer membrane lipase/esterase